MTLQNDIQPEKPVQLDTAEKESLQIDKLVLPLYQSIFWIRLFASCLIFYGALITVTGIGILIAWVPIWIGMLLLLMAKTVSQAYLKNDPLAFQRSLSRLKTIFTVLGFSSVALIIASFYFIKYAIEKSLF